MHFENAEGIRGMDTEAIEIVSSSARIILISAVNYGVATFVVNAILGRRRSLWSLCMYWAGKILIQGILIGYMLQHYYGDAQWLQILNVSTVLIFAVVTYIMYYITFQGEFLKVAIAALIGEVTTVFLGTFTSIFVNVIEGKKDILVYADSIQPLDFLIPVVNITLLLFFYHFAAPYLRKFKDYNLQHRKLLWTIFISYITLGSASILASYTHMVIVAAIAASCTIGFIVEVCFLVMKYQKSLTTKRKFMQMQQNITEAHYEAVQGQIRKMEQNQQRIDEQMKAIIRLQDSVVDCKRLKTYLSGLRKNYEDIRAGIYCDDWRIDALIYSQAQMLQKAGIEFECSLLKDNIGEIREDDFIQILLLLFNMGIELNGEAGTPKKKKVQLRTAVVKNQLVIDFFSTCGDKCRISKHGFRGCLRKYHGGICVNKSGKEVDIHLTL